LQPGLTAAGYTTSVAAAGALPTGCANHIELIRSPEAELKLITRLPHALESKPVEPVALAPTHILIGNRAVPIFGKGSPLQFQHRDRQVWLPAQEGVLVNELPVTVEIPLAPGDEIDHGELSYRLIIVRE
ncbi:MAG: hypothetical protein O7E57_17225, partial [Gammaproteobacteria bacterium]|nr:hypothetical protein [Gammaproteobacteria bacterium]